jgi:hypothetical protein
MEDAAVESGDGKCGVDAFELKSPFGAAHVNSEGVSSFYPDVDKPDLHLLQC